MAGPQEENGTVNATETDPLLGNRDPEASVGSPDATTQNDEEENGIPIADEPSTKYLLVIAATTWLGSFFAALDTTIVATLAGPISSSFNSFTLYSWVASAYLIANAAFQPLSGKLTDIFGRRNGLIFANLSFAVGNLICGLAKSPSVMILGRVVSGFGGGGLQTITVFIMSDLVPLRKRGLWQGFGNLVFGLGMGCGGVFGGLMNDKLNWRWGFLVQVPFFFLNAILAYFIINIPVKTSSKGRWRRVDFPGSILLVTALILLLIGVNTGGNQLPWTHPLILTSIPLSLLVLAAYTYVEACVVPEPIIPVRLLTDRTVASACLTNWFCAMAAFASLYYLPLFAQAKGESSARAGLRQIPFAAGTSFGSLLSGYIMRLTGRYRLLTFTIMLIFVLSGILLSTTITSFSSPDWRPYLYLTLTGFGYGGTLTVTIVAMIAAVEHSHQATITAASYAFRSTGSSIGITIVSAVFQNTLSKQLWSRFGDYEPQPQPQPPSSSHPGSTSTAAEIINRIRQNFSAITNPEANGIPESWRPGVKDSYMIAFRAVFGTILAMIVLGAGFSAGMREHRLHGNLARK